MSISGKHSYRFGFLKSEKWKIVRLEALVRENSICQICGIRDLSNDAHHVWYPLDIYETKQEQLVVLCRACHTFVHEVMPDCKTTNEQEGKRIWEKFSNAVKNWKESRIQFFETGITGGLQSLRDAYLNLKQDLEKKTQQELTAKTIISEIKKWSKAYDVYKEVVDKKKNKN